MMNNEYRYQPSYSIHPGEFVEELIETVGMKQSELAIRLGITTKHLSNVINGKAAVTVDLAYALERVFMTHPAKYWMALQTNYDLIEKHNQIEQEHSEEQNKEWFEQFDYANLVKLGFVKEKDTRKTLSAKISNLLDFFGCADIDSWNNLYCGDLPAACRIVGASTVKIGNTSAWIRAGQTIANNSIYDMPNYDKAKFKSNLLKIRELTIDTTNGFSKKMQELCEEAGVKLLFIHEIPKSGICGAAYWVNDNKIPCIQMSLRFKKNDHFWFTFFHEAAHILKEHKKMIYLDCDTVEKNDIEAEADKISGDILIPPAAYKAFVAKRSFYNDDIIRFAKLIKIHPGIVVGRLQHEGKIQWSWHNSLKATFAWAE